MVFVIIFLNAGTQQMQILRDGFDCGKALELSTIILGKNGDIVFFSKIAGETNLSSGL